MSETAPTEGKKSFLRSFPLTFWIANVMELFERGAYYGLNALLARYLTDKVGGGLGFQEDQVGLVYQLRTRIRPFGPTQHFQPGEARRSGDPQRHQRVVPVIGGKDRDGFYGSWGNRANP